MHCKGSCELLYLWFIIIISVFITKEIKLILLCFIMKCGKEPRKTFVLQIMAIYKGNKECRKLYLTQSRKEKSDGSMLQLQRSFSEIFIIHKLSSFGQMWPGHIQDQIINFTCVLWVIFPTPFLQSKQMWAGMGTTKSWTSFIYGRPK